MPKKEKEESGELRPVETGGPPAMTRRIPPVRLALALAIAMTADALDVAFPIVSIPVDVVTALLLCLVFGWRWEIFVILVPEVLPFTALFPSWVLLVLYLAGTKKFPA